MINEGLLLQRIDMLTAAVQTIAGMMGSRLTRAQMCERLGVHRNTLARKLLEPGFPQAGKDGKWLLSEVLAWEVNNVR